MISKGMMNLERWQRGAKAGLSPALLFCAVIVGLLVGCKAAPKGPKFDPRASQTNAMNLTLVTNFTKVESTNVIRPEWRQAPTNFYTLGPGDRIEIEILTDKSSRAITAVGPDGKIYYHLLPGLDVWGLTLAEARDKIQRELEKLVVNPQVALQLRGVDSKRIWMLGRVQKAGVYSMAAPMTALESLSMAGGTLTSSASGTTEDLADLSHAFIIRNGERLPVDFAALINRGDMSQNIYLQPDDFVYFPSSIARDIYVLGAVRLPRAVQRNQGTLMAALAAAGGPVKNAYLSHVAIVRGSLAKPEMAIVNVEDILKGKATDVVLEPRDIVFVPLSPYRYLSKYADLILTTFVRAVAINEGSRAGGATTPAGVSIGVVNFPQATTPVITPGN
jgi:protein involved in polysaccharide export with SLBB domain